MPILADKPRYPANWRGIRAAILERAGHRCEKCGIPNHAWRNKVTGEWAHDAGMVDLMDGGDMRRPMDDRQARYESRRWDARKAA